MLRDDQLVDLFTRLDRIDARLERTEEKQDYMISVGRTHTNELMELRRQAFMNAPPIAVPVVASIFVSVLVAVAFWGCR
jgi:hypothetical protein